MKFNKTYLALAMTALLLVGCSSTDEQDSSLADAAQGTDASTSGLSDGSMNGSQFGGGSGYGNGSGGGGSNSRLGPEFSDPNNPLSKQIIYFELDSSQVKQDYVPVVAAHARYLISHANQHVILGGHTDERKAPANIISPWVNNAPSPWKE